MSEEKVLTLRGKRAVWAPGGGSGPIDPKRLPEGYPYKEQSEKALLEDYVLEPYNQGGTLMGGFSGAFFVAGNTYKITWNGTPYVCTAVEIQGSAAIGNLANFGGAGNNEPFAMSVSGDTTTILILEENAEYIVSISEFSETIYPMAEEYIQLTSPNGTKYQLTVADDGTLSAVAAE